MFQQSFSRDDSRRPWTFSVSLLTQLLVIAVAVLVPLLSEPLMPALSAALVTLEAPRPPRSAPEPPPQQATPVRPEQFTAELRQPTSMPPQAALITDKPRAEVMTQGPFIPGASLDGVPDGIISRITRDVVRPPVSPPPAAEPEPEPQPIQVGGSVQAAKVLQKVQPVYPDIAKRVGVSGLVRLQAIIAADGTIAELNVVSGHPMLIRAAIDAVSQWRYPPTVLNGRPVPVNTVIDVNFNLSR